MPSSTLDSRRGAASRALGLLALALGACGLLLELGARLVVPHISATEHRIATDSRAAAALRPRSTSGGATVLIVGNSLLLEGVDRQQLHSLMAPRYDVSELPVENTTYWDWYFGLRRLFTQGSRPAAVVLCMTAGQTLSDATDGGRFAFSMMRMRDLWRVARLSHLDATATSEYFFSNLSAWLGLRAGLRNAVLQKWLPGAPLLAQTLASRTGGAPAAPPRIPNCWRGGSQHCSRSRRMPAQSFASWLHLYWVARMRGAAPLPRSRGSGSGC